jgi:hypothetical protein
LNGGKKNIPREDFTTIYCGEKMWNNNEILKKHNNVVLFTVVGEQLTR